MRNRAADLIESLVARRITNDEFDDGYPLGSGDRAISPIFWQVWHFYDDLHEHRLEGEYALTSDGKELLDRCVRFLRSELPYRWPPLESVPILPRLICLLTSKYQRRDPEAWPFQSHSEGKTVG